jgi:glucose-1-phosphate thymidylyltransferase
LVKKIKGIILAGGHGTRLFPLTKGTSKQLIPVYDKPMIYYPLSVLMDTEIYDILIISTPNDTKRFEDLFGNGNEIGLNISYAIQNEPRGIAEAFIIGKEFIGNDHVCLILGDNIFHGNNFKFILKSAKNKLIEKNICSIFGYQVNNPSNFGVIEIDSFNNIISIEEKPIKPKSNHAVVGLYFYTNDVVDVVKQITPSLRQELEITDINEYYLSMDKLECIELDKSFSWLDTGTFDSLIEASEYMKNVEISTGSKVGCIEEIAFENKLINLKQLKTIANSMIQSSYGKYLLNKVNNLEK